jgi:spore maturation protein CgeB
MIRVFNQSRVNLNLSNASTPSLTPISREKNMARRLPSHSLNFVPFGSQLKTMGKRWLSTRHSATVEYTPDRSNADGALYPDQIKGRNFEIPGCGGFLLTGRADNLDDYYEVGKEIVCFESTQDLIEKVRHHLHDEGERAAIAQAGYQRTLREHTYAHRFSEIFQRLGLPSRPLSEVLAGKLPPGQTEEVH